MSEQQDRIDLLKGMMAQHGIAAGFQPHAADGEAPPPPREE
jgi:hypothetical protein